MMKTLLMSKLFLSIALSTSVLAATQQDVINFLEKGLSNKRSITDLKLKVIKKDKVSGTKDWDAYVIELNAKAITQSGLKDIKTRNVYFVNGDYITTDLTNMKTKKNALSPYIRDVKMFNMQQQALHLPKFTPNEYKKENLLYGNADAKHKVAIFSDPLCPFCYDYVPEALEYMKKYPEIFAVYYYDFPLVKIHPASPTIVKAALVAKKQGKKDIVINMYNIEIDANETNEKKILDVFNKTFGTKVTIKDINQPDIIKHVKSDAQVVQKLQVGGTPKFYFDGTLDVMKNKYREVKIK
jgi:thiol:disulfide interchange protein DsbC